MAVGQGYVKHGSGRINTKVIDGQFWALYSKRWHKVAKAWAWYGGTKTWKQWYPHGGGTGGTGTSHPTKTVTLSGRRLSTTSWSFVVGSHAGHVTRATLIVTTISGLPHVIHGTVSGVTLNQGTGTTKSYHFSASTANHSLVRITFPSTAAHYIKNAQLRITYST